MSPGLAGAVAEWFKGTVLHTVDVLCRASRGFESHSHRKSIIPLQEGDGKFCIDILISSAFPFEKGAITFEIA